MIIIIIIKITVKMMIIKIMIITEWICSERPITIG